VHRHAPMPRPGVCEHTLDHFWIRMPLCDGNIYGEAAPLCVIELYHPPAWRSTAARPPCVIVPGLDPTLKQMQLHLPVKVITLVDLYHFQPVQVQQVRPIACDVPRQLISDNVQLNVRLNLLRGQQRTCAYTRSVPAVTRQAAKAGRGRDRKQPVAGA
jgi:hypothetical protein